MTSIAFTGDVAFTKYFANSCDNNNLLSADIVIGHHPHVSQNYETFGKKTAFYSLGNFIFDTNYQRIQNYTQYGMLIKINFNNNDYSWEYLAIKINRESATISKSQPPEIFCNISPKRKFHI